MEYNDVIRSVSSNQHEILYNIMNLHNNGKPFDCDMTYSIGKFYGKFNIEYPDGTKHEIEIPQPQYKFDVMPQVEGVEKIETNGPLPLDSESINSIVIDLPFVISPSESPSVFNKDKKSNIIFKRFSGYYPWWTMFDSYSHWINEAYRVLKDGGICVFKTQSTISGGKNLMTPYYSWMIAERCGFYTLDEFILTAKNRLHSGKIKKQMHARKFHSHFLVFKKDSKQKPIDYFKWHHINNKARQDDNN